MKHYVLVSLVPYRTLHKAFLNQETKNDNSKIDDYRLQVDSLDVPSNVLILIQVVNYIKSLIYLYRLLMN